MATKAKSKGKTASKVQAKSGRDRSKSGLRAGGLAKSKKGVAAKESAKSKDSGKNKSARKAKAPAPKKSVPKPAKPKTAAKAQKSPPKTKAVAVKKQAVKAESKKAVPKTAAAKAAPVAAAKPAKQVTPGPVPAPVIPPKPPAPKTKMLEKELLFGLAKAIKDSVEPLVRSVRGREVTGTAQSGDATFQLDKVAEKALMTYLRDAKAPVAYYSEDSGYSTFTSGAPQHLLIVDPVDGSRAAKSGFESCVVCIGSTRVIERPRIGDIDNAVVLEIIGPRMFYAERGKGTRVYVEDGIKKPKLSTNTYLESLTWAMTVPARPAELIFPTAAKLIDLSSLKGGFFACNSSSYSLTRLVTQQLDACVDIANRYLRDIPEAVKDQFINAGRGAVLGIAPYDIAASLLVALEAGCVVTDAYGKSLEDVLLLDSSEANHQSMIAASNKELHEKLMIFFDTRIKQIEHLWKRRLQIAGGDDA
ncbi:MAG: hypothetical protein AMXMBFR84_02610 [Candidatus Hydrogenedentota bacterium]